MFPKNMICSNYTTNWARSLTGESLGIAMTDGELDFLDSYFFAIWKLIEKVVKMYSALFATSLVGSQHRNL